MPMELKEVILKRNATRNFSTEKVNKEELEHALNLASLAPSAKNNQPTKVIIVDSIEGIEKIDLSTPCRYNASTVLIICSDKNIAFNNNGHSTYEIDASIFATHLMLSLTNYNIDNIWIDLFNRDIIKQEFNLDNNIEPICLIPIGYSIDKTIVSPNHNIRKELDEIIEYR